MTTLTIEERNALCQQYEIIKRANGWNTNNTTTLFVFYTIKGYHHFRNHPLVGTQMLLKCIPEPNNTFNRFAVKVVAPNAQELPNDILNLTTREGINRQTVSDIAGKTIGRVPSDMTQILSEGLDNGDIIRAHAVYYGQMHYGGPIAGGGPALKCLYCVDVKTNKVNDLRLKFNQAAQNH